MADHQAVVLLETKLGAAIQDQCPHTVDEFSLRTEASICLGALDQKDSSTTLLLLRGPNALLNDVPGGMAGTPCANLQLRLKLEPVAGYGWWQRQPVVSPQGMLLTLFALHFPNTSSRNRFIEATRSHGDYCWKNEPDTKMYGLGLVVDAAGDQCAVEPGDLVVAMICTDAAAIDKHRDDPRHQKLGAQIADLGIAVENTLSKTYHLTGQGFLGREQNS